MNYNIVTHPPGPVKLVPCPVCNGPSAHPDQPPGQVWDAIWDRPVTCWECDGLGTLTLDEAAEFARETEDEALAALLAERDPALTPAERLREMGFSHVGGAIL